MVYSRGTDKAIALPTRIRLNTDNHTANSVLEAFINVGLGKLVLIITDCAEDRLAFVNAGNVLALLAGLCITSQVH